MATRASRDGQSTLQAKFEQALELQRAGNHKAALKRLRLVLKENPDHPQILNLMSLSLAGTGDLAKARRALEKAVKVAPDHADSWGNLGMLHYQDNRLEPAADAFQRCCALSPDSFSAHIRYGDVCLDIDRFEEAEHAYAQAVSLQLEDARALRGLAQAKMFLGKWQEGREAVDAALKQSPGDTFVLSLKVLADMELGDGDSAKSLLDFDRLISVVDFDTPDGFDDMTSFNEALCEHSLNHHSIVYEPGGKSTRKGYQTTDLTADENIGPIAPLIGLIENAIGEYRDAHALDPDHPFLAQRPEKWTIYLWATVLESQGHQAAHFHPSGWLSGVYYARVPDVITGDGGSEDGWIEFGRMEKYTKAKAEPLVKSYQPKEGRVVFFPSYFYHLTKPFDSDEKRISLAFDVIPSV